MKIKIIKISKISKISLIYKSKIIIIKVIKKSK